jgi:hypothetical protein
VKASTCCHTPDKCTAGEAFVAQHEQCRRKCSPAASGRVQAVPRCLTVALGCQAKRSNLSADRRLAKAFRPVGISRHAHGSAWNAWTPHRSSSGKPASPACLPAPANCCHLAASLAPNLPALPMTPNRRTQPLPSGSTCPGLLRPAVRPGGRNVLSLGYHEQPDRDQGRDQKGGGTQSEESAERSVEEGRSLRAWRPSCCRCCPSRRRGLHGAQGHGLAQRMLCSRFPDCLQLSDCETAGPPAELMLVGLPALPYVSEQPKPTAVVAAAFNLTCATTNLFMGCDADQV